MDSGHRHERGRVGQVREQNRGLVLEHLRRLGPLSRSDLARHLKLNPSTLTRIIGPLLEEGLVAEVGVEPALAGRKPVLVDLVPDAVHVIGVEVEIDRIRALAADLDGTIVCSTEQAIEDSSEESVIGLIREEIQTVLAVLDRQHSRAAGIGLAIHGVVDSGAGRVVYPPAFGWEQLELGALLREEFGLPVRLENNARAMSLGEQWFGAARNDSDFICVKIGPGIGSGIVLGSRLFRGADFSAGELGHTTVENDGIRCRCGNYGCLETIASTLAVEERVRRLLKEGAASVLHERAALDQVNAAAVFQAAADNDPLALQVLADMARYIGIAIANLNNLLNPEKVLLGGDIYPVLAIVLPQIEDVVRRRSMGMAAERLQLAAVQLGADAVALGAVALILDELFYGTLSV